MKKYEQIKNYLKEVEKITYLNNLVYWELHVNGSKNSKDYLLEVLTELSGKSFSLTTSEEYGQLLIDLINDEEFNTLSEQEQRYFKLLHERYDNFKKIPVDFYKEYINNTNKAVTVWEQAKAENNYEKFKPYLAKNIELSKQYYSYISDKDDLYDVMLEQYERGMNSKTIDKLFNRLKEVLIPLIKEVEQPQIKVEQTYTNEESLNIARYLLDYIGFDNNRGQLGIYPHGFTQTINHDDVRIAFCSKEGPASFVGTIIHEGGHGIFEQNINKDIYLSNTDNSLGLHESQSRFYENILGRNINFWIPIYDEISKMLKLDITIEEFIKALNNVHCGLIRINADQLTYALHIIIRYEIERDLFNDKITVEQLPEIWNSKMKQYLNVIPTKDSEGLMQDVHWAEGLFGYFPTYLIGNIYDGMFLEAIEKELGPVDEILKKGEIKKITQFLNKHIHEYGGIYTYEEIMNNVCHKEISPEPIINYYQKKYQRKK